MLAQQLQAKNNFKARAKVYQKNYAAFFEEILQVKTLEDYHYKILKSVQENERTAVSACHDVGKSYMAARIAIAFLMLNPNSKVITTAPTYNQVKRILWSELRSAVSAAVMPLGGKLNETDWTLSPDWFAIGFTSKNEVTGGEGQGTQSSFQGFHAEGGILVIFDEATGIPYNVWTMAEGLLTQSNVKFLAIGNPTSTSSEFYSCFKSKAWSKVYLSCFDSPNLKANGMTDIKKLQKEVDYVKSLKDSDAQKRLDSYKVVRPYLLTTRWVIQSIMKWGMEHPLTVSKILGKFPQGGDNTLVPLGFIEQAQLRTYEPKKTDRKIIGVDVARFGSNATIMTGLHGLQQLLKRDFHKFDTVEVTGEVIALSREMDGVDVIVVDETGLGSGVVDNLREAIRNGDLPQTTEIRGVQFGSTDMEDEDKEKYFNLKARMFGLLQDDMKREDGLCLIDDSVYQDELPTIRYRFNSKGQMVIESKDEYKKRTGRDSPDNADSLALANFGRYDDLNAGAFTKSYDKKATKNRTMSGGLKSGKRW